MNSTYPDLAHPIRGARLTGQTRPSAPASAGGLRGARAAPPGPAEVRAQAAGAAGGAGRGAGMQDGTRRVRLEQSLRGAGGPGARARLGLEGVASESALLDVQLLQVGEGPGFGLNGVPWIDNLQYEDRQGRAQAEERPTPRAGAPPGSAAPPRPPPNVAGTPARGAHRTPSWMMRLMHGRGQPATNARGPGRAGSSHTTPSLWIHRGRFANPWPAQLARCALQTRPPPRQTSRQAGRGLGAAPDTASVVTWHPLKRRKLFIRM